MEVIKELYKTILKRKSEKSENSYTCYLFEKGLDKILKKCGEECSETIIAAKNGDNNETVNEICDLMYHVLVLMAELNIDINSIEEELKIRNLKVGNLKSIKNTDIYT